MLSFNLVVSAQTTYNYTCPEEYRAARLELLYNLAVKVIDDEPAIENYLDNNREGDDFNFQGAYCRDSSYRALLCTGRNGRICVNELWYKTGDEVEAEGGNPKTIRTKSRFISIADYNEDKYQCRKFITGTNLTDYDRRFSNYNLAYVLLKAYQMDDIYTSWTLFYYKRLEDYFLAYPSGDEVIKNYINYTVDIDESRMVPPLLETKDFLENLFACVKDLEDISYLNLRYDGKPDLSSLFDYAYTSQFDLENCRAYGDENQCRCLENGGIWIAIGCVDPTPVGVLTRLVQLGLGIMGGVALIQIIYAGIMYQSGNEEKIRKAREQLLATLTGLAVLVFSVLIVQILGVNLLDTVPAGLL